MSERERFLNGYKLIYRPDHSTAMKSDNWEGWVYEHRYVVEVELGIYLKDGEVVHHLDGNRSNNHISNLIVLSISDHMKLHRWMESQIITPNPSLTLKPATITSPNPKPVTRTSPNHYPKPNPVTRTCPNCGSTFVRRNTESKFCNHECSALHSRRVERPTKEQLEELIWKHPFTHVAKQYSVSDKAVKKWCKAYGITLPPYYHNRKKL